MNPMLFVLALLLLTGPLLMLLGGINLRPDPFDKSIPPLEIIVDRLTRKPDSPPRIKWHRRPARVRGWIALAFGTLIFAAGIAGAFTITGE